MDERDAVLGLNALAALNAANAWRPLAGRRLPRAAMFSFLAGWPTSELPGQALGAHLALTAVAAARGDLSGRRGSVSAALAALTAAGLVAQRRSAAAATDVYENALVDALGADYRDRIATPDFPGADAADAGAPGLLRMVRIRRRFAHHTDIPYGPAGSRNHLDVWARDDLPADGRAPVLVQVPGGAWTVGNKQSQAYPLMSHLAERGWVCVSISYRLSPRSVWPDHIVDVKRAIAWVRDNIASYGGDPGFIAVTGGSAGGHLSSLAALTPGEGEWQPGFEDADTSVAAAAPFYGAYDFTDRDGVGNRGLVPLVEQRVIQRSIATDRAIFEAASPMSRINADAPPFLISHGSNDSLIPVQEARLFAQRLRAVSRAPVAYAEIPRAQHAYDTFGSPRATIAAEAVGRFLGHVYGDYRQRRAPTLTDTVG